MNYYNKYLKYKNKFINLEKKNPSIRIISGSQYSILEDVKVLLKYLPNSTSRLFEDTPQEKVDINIFIEYPYDTKFIDYASENWIIINHERFGNRDEYKEKDIEMLKKISIILCKSKVGIEVAKYIRKKYNLKYNIYFTKFTTIFNKINVKKKWDKIINSSGSSRFKNTDIILSTWLNNPKLPKIIITCYKKCLDNVAYYIKYNKLTEIINNNVKNIYFYNKLIPKDKFEIIKNQYGLHICTSLSEGFGHYINEGRIVGSVVLTVDLSPMNELIDNTSGILIPCSNIKDKKTGVKKCLFKEEDLLKGVKKYLNLSTKEKKILGDNAYKKFKQDHKFFINKMNILLNNYKDKKKIKFE